MLEDYEMTDHISMDAKKSGQNINISLLDLINRQTGIYIELSLAHSSFIPHCFSVSLLLIL